MEKVDLLIGKDEQIAPDKVGGGGFIHGKYFGYWNELDISLELDGYATVGFKAPFEVSRKEFRDTFRPFSFKPIELSINLETIFKGTLVDVNPTLGSGEKSVVVTGYSLPHILADCDMPAKSLPHEFLNLDLRAICDQVCKPFKIGVDFQAADAGTKFPKVKLETNKKVHDFLVELAKQRNLVLSSNAEGQLLVWQSVTPGGYHQPRAVFEQGKSPLSRVEATFSPREYFSEITGFGKKTRKLPSARWTEVNAWLPEILRPSTFSLDNTERADVPEATKARMARMFGNMASYKILDLPTWRDPQGNLWAPNTTVKLFAPDAMCYRPTEFLVRRVELHQDKNCEKATLELVLPGAFSGKIPTELPWIED